MRRDQKRTVAQVVIERVGFTKALRVQVFVSCWWIATAELKRSPRTVDEFAAFWSMDRRKAFRDQALFRRAWPEFETPSDLATALDIDPVLEGLTKRDEARLSTELLSWPAP